MNRIELVTEMPDRRLNTEALGNFRNSLKCELQKIQLSLISMRVLIQNTKISYIFF